MAYAKDAKTHRELRNLVCLVCFNKLKTMKPITGSPTAPSSLLQKILISFMENYDPANPKLPSALCSHCFNHIQRNPDKLADPIDFSKLEFPSMAQIRELKLASLDEMRGCTCSLCVVGVVEVITIQNFLPGPPEMLSLV